MQSDAGMSQRNQTGKEENKRATRITVSLPPESYDGLVRVAKNKKVSAAWVVREAVDKYLAGDLPLIYSALKS